MLPICSDAPCMFRHPHISKHPTHLYVPLCSPLHLYISRGYLYMIWGWGHLYNQYWVFGCYYKDNIQNICMYSYTIGYNWNIYKNHVLTIMWIMRIISGLLLGLVSITMWYYTTNSIYCGTSLWSFCLSAAGTIVAHCQLPVYARVSYLCYAAAVRYKSVFEFHCHSVVDFKIAPCAHCLKKSCFITRP